MTEEETQVKGPKFTKQALTKLDRDVLNKDNWTSAELKLVVETAVESNDKETTARDNAVWIQSSAAYILFAHGQFEEKGSKKAYGDKIGKSATRVGDYILYGRAVVRHSIDPAGEDFELLKKGASGGHRKQINEYVDRVPADFDHEEFHNLLVEAVRVEKEKADKRNAERQAERESQPKVGTREAALKGLEGATTAVEKFKGVFRDDLAQIVAVIARLQAVVDHNFDAKEETEAAA